jgi:hypothetical protein
LQQFDLKTGFVIDQLMIRHFRVKVIKWNRRCSSTRWIHQVSELSASGLWAASRGNHSLNLKISAAGLFRSDVTQARGVRPFPRRLPKIRQRISRISSSATICFTAATYLLRAVEF